MQRHRTEVAHAPALASHVPHFRCGYCDRKFVRTCSKRFVIDKLGIISLCELIPVWGLDNPQQLLAAGSIGVDLQAASLFR